MSVESTAPPSPSLELSLGPFEAPVSGEGQPLVAPRTARHDVVFWISIGWLVLMGLVAIFAGLLPLPDPNVPTGLARAAPSLHHLFGTDTVGYDLLSECLHGARMSMLVGVSSAAAGLLVGGFIGIVSGFARGLTDQVLSWLVDVLLAFPALVFALAVIAFVGASMISVIVAIAVLSIPGYARVARAATLACAQQTYVSAARSMGATRRRIVLRELVPNVAVSLLSYAALGAAIAIIAEGSLAFLGLSAPDVASWGNLILQGQQQLTAAPQAALAPMAMMFLTIVALNFVGEHVGGVLDPREGQL